LAAHARVFSRIAAQPLCLERRQGTAAFHFSRRLVESVPQRAIGLQREVNDGHAACKIALRFDVHEVRRLRSNDRRIHRDGHGDRVWQTYPVFSGLLKNRFLRPAVALNGKFGNGCVET